MNKIRIYGSCIWNSKFKTWANICFYFSPNSYCWRFFFLGKNIIGMTAVLGSIATLAGVFIYGNKIKKDERIQKEKLLNQ